MTRNFRKAPRQPGHAPRPVPVRICMQPARPYPPGPRAEAWPRLALWRKKLDSHIIKDKPSETWQPSWSYASATTYRDVYTVTSGTTSSSSWQY